MNCSSCKWWLPLPSGLGRCHRNPPVSTGVFPLTRSGDFCGQHEPKEGTDEYWAKVQKVAVAPALAAHKVILDKLADLGEKLEKAMSEYEPEADHIADAGHKPVPPALAAAGEWHAGRLYTCNKGESEKDVYARVEQQSKQLAAIIQRHFEPLYTEVAKRDSQSALRCLFHHPRYTGTEK